LPSSPVRRKPLKHDNLDKREKPRFDRIKFYEERGLILTVCIAAATLTGDIVGVSDTMVSFNDQIPAQDLGIIKHFFLCPGWGIMFATNDITRPRAVIDRAVHRLRDVKEHTADTVRSAVSDAYRDAVNEQTTRRYLWPLGIEKLSEFREVGLMQFGARTFSNMRLKIERFNLGVQFLVVGVDPPTDRAHIFEIDNPGICDDHRDLGYWAVGSGAAMALASITSYPLGIDVENVLFRVCEAKFAAETANGVGKFTQAMVMTKSGDILALLSNDIAKLRKIWRDRATAPPPPEALDLIRGQLNRMTRSSSSPNC
jgi:20S proteasome alpha/beta subunit